MPLNENEKKLMQVEGFEQRVAQLSATMPLAKAYEIAEKEVFEISGLKMYPSLNAFKIKRTRDARYRGQRRTSELKQNYLSKRYRE